MRLFGGLARFHLWTRKVSSTSSPSPVKELKHWHHGDPAALKIKMQEANFNLKRFQNLLNDKGFDICMPFSVSDYNLKSTKYPLPTFDSSVDNLAVLVGSTKHFWTYFSDWIRTHDLIPKDPVDEYAKVTVMNILKTEPFNNIKHELRYSNEGPRSGRFVHVQTAGHVSGFSYYDQDTMWSVHPEYGTWFVFRTVVVFDLPFDSNLKPTPADALLTPEEKDEIKKWTDVATKEGWRNPETLLKIRDIPKIGKEKYRYEGDMLDYFYPTHRTKAQVLEDIHKAKQQAPSDSTDHCGLINAEC